MSELPPSYERLIMDVGTHRRFGLLAEAGAHDAPEAVALSECVAIGDGEAEVAIVVRDDWHRRGLGAAVAAETLLAAEARGYQRFVARVLFANVAGRRLLSRVGVVVSTTVESGVSEITFVRRRDESGAHDAAASWSAGREAT